MTKKEFKKIRREVLSDKSITGISYDPRTLESDPKIILIREVKKPNDRY